MEEWDIITLSGLSARANHGVYDFERAGSQDFVADITLHVDLRKAAASDEIADTVDYSRVAEDAVQVMTGPAVYLIETLASKLAELAMTYPGVGKVEVTVHKPMAPLKHSFQDVSVTVIREVREGFEARHRTLVESDDAADATVTADVGIDDDRSDGGADADGDTVVDDQPAEEAGVRVDGDDDRADATRHDHGVAQAAPLADETPTPSVAQSISSVTSSPAPAAAPSDRAAPVAARAGRRARTDEDLTFRATPGRSHTVVYDVVLALGANKGDIAANMRGAVEALDKLDGFEVLAVSPLVKTEPVLEPGALPQDDYFNAVVLGKTILAPPALLAALQAIESDHGRRRVSRWGSRTLDIDIVDLDAMVLSTRSLTVPHPRAHERAFVLYPWLKVDADASLPRKGRVRDLLYRAPDLGGVLGQFDEWLTGDDDGGLGPEVPLHLAPRRHQDKRWRVPDVSPEKVTLRGEDVVLEPLREDSIFQTLLRKETAPSAPQVSTVDQSAPATDAPAPIAEKSPAPAPQKPPARKRARASVPAVAEAPAVDVPRERPVATAPAASEPTYVSVHRAETEAELQAPEPPREDAPSVPAADSTRTIGHGPADAVPDDAAPHTHVAHHHVTRVPWRTRIDGHHSAPHRQPPVEMQELPEWDFRGSTRSVRVVDSVERADEEPRQDRPPVEIRRVVRGVTVRPTPTGTFPVTRAHRHTEGH